MAVHYVGETDTLLARHRCDRCGAQAFAWAKIRASDKIALKFCAHHFNRHRDALLKIASLVVDERYRLGGYYAKDAGVDAPRD